MKAFFRFLLGFFFIVAGCVHLIRPEAYREMMPPYIPYPLEMIYLSGAIEIGLGFLVVIPKTSRLAAWGLVLLLLAVFPANVHMALHPQLFDNIPLWILYARLPLQGVFIAWAYWFTRPDSRSPFG